jgi:DNA-binding CsgD family transcriptional regulator
VDRRLKRSLWRSRMPTTAPPGRPFWASCPSGSGTARAQEPPAPRPPEGLAQRVTEAVGVSEPRAAATRLSPRLRQTLDRLLKGKREKQVADELGLSPGTVHGYVHALYRRFRVSSRAELSARFLDLDHHAGPGPGELLRQA